LTIAILQIQIGWLWSTKTLCWC